MVTFPGFPYAGRSISMAKDFREQEEKAYRELGTRLADQPGLIQSMPGQEQRIARGVAEGRKPFDIAAEEGISEDAVWTVIRALQNAVSGNVSSRGYETAGMGADTDPGVTGGYGETGFGSIGNEPPVPLPGEPEEEPEKS
jgi:hypothetical protein